MTLVLQSLHIHGWPVIGTVLVVAGTFVVLCVHQFWRR
jgi:hypothetical protein